MTRLPTAGVLALSRRLRAAARLTLSALGVLAVATAAAAALPPPLQQVLHNQRIDADSISLWVQRIGDTEPLIAHHADTPRNAASVTKLLTSLAALEQLGPAHRWQTSVYALRDPAAPERAQLLIVGGGDPLLRVEDLWRLAQRVRQAGITTQLGPLQRDSSYFSIDHPDPGAFNNQPLRVYNQPPHPLLINYNAVWFRIANTAGGGVSIIADPPLAGLELRQRVRSVNRACGGFQRGVAVNVDATGVVHLDGEYPAACRDDFALVRRVVDPEDYLRDAWGLVWAQWDGDVAPAGADPVRERRDWQRVAEHHSQTLGELLAPINKSSSNVISRQVKMTLAAEAGLYSAAEGRAQILSTLRGIGVDVDGVVFDSAAGLSRTQRITARQVASVLAHGQAHVHAPEFLASLSLLGVDGTLRERLVDHPLAARARLKTGRLNAVSALAGLVRTHDDETYLLVLMVNAEEAHRGPGEVLQDAVLDWLHAR